MSLYETFWEIDETHTVTYNWWLNFQRELKEETSPEQEPLVSSMEEVVDFLAKSEDDFQFVHGKKELKNK